MKKVHLEKMKPFVASEEQLKKLLAVLKKRRDGAVAKHRDIAYRRGKNNADWAFEVGKAEAYADAADQLRWAVNGALL